VFNDPYNTVQGYFRLSWFSEKYLFRVEEGLPKEAPSKIEAVLKDGKDFDDIRLANLRRPIAEFHFSEIRL